ncbi:MAG: phosphatidylglycerol lysyltransferase domain-containing protein [Dysgonomonas sp.]|nr:phosphatidylglycerol lysyltransferase domain-containing protein [Dysgonomonas sp.]
MINFKQITLSDKKDIDTCFAGNIYRACDFNFTNLYAWNAKFKTQFAIIGRTIFLRFQDSDGQLYYMMPIGKMPLTEAFNLIMQDAVENKIPFQMKAISIRMWENIQKEIPGKFRYLPDRNNDEYIYLSEKLIKLSGKKLQSKRNHINRFKADHPDWEYFPLISKNELDECIQMLDEWEQKSISRIDISQRYDYIATKIMLENFDYLQLRGGAVRVNGKIVAFTIGEPLTEDSFVVHVEKAFGDMNGAYTIINQQFIEHEASEFKYINREEDMGLENLRKAKMSYYPDILLEEGILIPNV